MVVKKPRLGQGLWWRSGAEESRTPDLIIANDALYQLSYRPDWMLCPIGCAGSGFWGAGRVGCGSRTGCLIGQVGMIAGWVDVVKIGVVVCV